MRFIKLLVKVCIAAVLMIIGLIGTDNAKEWGRIKPYHTTQREIKKIMKDYRVEVINECWEMYDNEYEKVHIHYICYPCSKEKQGTANLPKDRVNTIEIYYKRPLTLAQLGLKAENFSHYTVDHIKGHNLQDDQAGYALYIDKGNIYCAIYRAPRNEILKKRCK